jgi:hypothetical protein
VKEGDDIIGYCDNSCDRKDRVIYVKE